MLMTSSHEGVVDPLFPRYLKESGARAWLAGANRQRETRRRVAAPHIS